MAAVFVGREEELDALLALAHGVRETPVAAGFVQGNPGSGKSRLLAEVIARAGDDRCLQITGYEAEKAVPLAAASGVLRTLAGVGEEGKKLEDLVFARAEEAGSLDPLRVFEATHRALRALDQRVLVVDDVQWVDGLSLALLHYLVRAAVDVGQLLVLLTASRPSADADRFAASIGAMLPTDAVSRIELGGLQLEEGVALVQALTHQLNVDEATELWRSASGSPFWLEALIRAGGAPPDLGRLLRERLGGLGNDATHLVALLAVAARPLVVADVARLLEWPSERAESAARELVAAGVALEGGGTLRLAHDLIRDAATQTLAGETSSRLHRQLADWFEAEAGTDLRLLLEALYHRRAAGQPTLSLARRIALSPRRRLLGEPGLRQLEDAADEFGLNGPDALALQQAVASLADQLSEHERALHRWTLVADALTDPLERTSALLGAAQAALELGLEDEARRSLDRAEAIGGADETLAIELASHRADIPLTLGERREAETSPFASEAAARARALAVEKGGIDQLDARSLRAYEFAMRVRADAAYLEVNHDEKVAAAADRVAAARLLDEQTYLSACLTLALVHWSVEGVRQVRDEASRRVLPGMAFDAGVHLTQKLLGRGLLFEAQEAADQAQELAGRVPDFPRGRGRFSYYRCILALYRGNFEEGLRGLEREAAAEPLSVRRVNFDVERAHWLARVRGEALADEALASLAAAERYVESTHPPVVAGITRLVAGEVLARIGHIEEARAALADWDANYAPSQPWEPLRRRAAGALISWRTGQFQAAVAELQSVLAGFQQEEMALEAVWTQIDLGRVLLEVDRGSATAALRAAAATASALGATTLQELAEKELRAVGVRTWRRPPAAPTGADALRRLSAREREVALLVAKGASNPEIAEHLYLSRKTIEHHVSNALAKLGVRNRTELAAHLAVHGTQPGGRIDEIEERH
jgi:DNA-binding NarL/FixJ family response regulator